jgi:hypothetical protein
MTAPLRFHPRRKLLWRWLALLALCLLYGSGQWAIRQAGIVVGQQQALDDRIELEIQHRLYASGVREILMSGKPYTRVPVPGWNGFVDRVESEGSLLAPRYSGWHVELRVRGQTPQYNPYLVSSTAQVTPPPRPRSLAEVFGSHQVVDLAWRVRKAMLVLCAGLWLACVALVPFAGRPWRRSLGGISVGAAAAALVGVIFNPAPGPAAPDGILCINCIALLIGISITLLPSRRLPPNLCTACRYDLTGNISGVCPECGTPTQAEVRRRKELELAPFVDAIAHVTVEPATEFEEERCV